METFEACMPKQETPLKLVGNGSFPEIVLFSPAIGSCLGCRWGVCKRGPCLSLRGYGHVICCSLSQAIDRDASAFRTWVYWKWDLHPCQKWMLFHVHHYHTSCFFFFILTLKTIISNNSRGKQLNISIWRADWICMVFFSVKIDMWWNAVQLEGWLGW